MFLGAEEQTYPESQKPDFEWRQGSSPQKREGRTGGPRWHHTYNRGPLTVHLGWQLAVSIAALAIPSCPHLLRCDLLSFSPSASAVGEASCRDGAKRCLSAAQMKLQILSDVYPDSLSCSQKPTLLDNS